MIVSKLGDVAIRSRLKQSKFKSALTCQPQNLFGQSGTRSTVQAELTLVSLGQVLRE